MKTNIQHHTTINESNKLLQLKVPLFLESIKNSQNILLIPHTNPDFDALGSAYALNNLLQAQNKNTRVGLQTKLLPRHRQVFPDYKKCSTFSMQDLQKQIMPDTILLLDIGSPSRSGIYSSLLNNSDIFVIVLDHHPEIETYGNLNISSPSYSSTCELLWHILKHTNWPPNKFVATCLYAGIIYDTGSFRYSNTSVQTHSVASDLLQFSLDTNWIYECVFSNFTKTGIKLRQKVINEAQFFHKDSIATTSLSFQDIQNMSISKDDLEGIGTQALSLRSVTITVHFFEKDCNLTKVSLRTKLDIPLNKIAQEHGGGGHPKACGFIVHEPLSSLRERFIPQFVEQCKLLLKQHTTM